MIFSQEKNLDLILEIARFERSRTMVKKCRWLMVDSMIHLVADLNNLTYKNILECVLTSNILIMEK